jgi:RNA polymerase sigma factor (sigma-70 family)
MQEFVWPRSKVRDHDRLADVKPDPDLALLQAWRDGDRGAGNKLLRQYLQPLRRFFEGKLPPADEEDMIQQTLLGCVRGATRFRSEAKFKTYLFSIAHKTLANHLRCRRNKEGRTDALELNKVSARELAPTPASVLAKGRRHRLMVEALRSITLDDQIILELFYWERMSVPEICEIYEDLKEPALRGRLGRARNAFRKKLAELAEGPEEFNATFDAFEANTWAGDVYQRRDQLSPTRKKVPRA